MLHLGLPCRSSRIAAVEVIILFQQSADLFVFRSHRQRQNKAANDVECPFVQLWHALPQHVTVAAWRKMLRLLRVGAYAWSLGLIRKLAGCAVSRVDSLAVRTEQCCSLGVAAHNDANLAWPEEVTRSGPIRAGSGAAA